MIIINNIKKHFANIELAKFLTNVVIIFTFFEIIFLNNVIIYNFDNENNIIINLQQIIEFFSNLERKLISSS